MDYAVIRISEAGDDGVFFRNSVRRAHLSLPFKGRAGVGMG